MLLVRGESMVDAGIFDGDLVVVRRQADADYGNTVAALIDGEEATVKRLRCESGKVLLLPENPAYEPLVFTQGCSCWAGWWRCCAACADPASYYVCGTPSPPGP